MMQKIYSLTPFPSVIGYPSNIVGTVSRKNSRFQRVGWEHGTKVNAVNTIVMHPSLVRVK